jgi:ketosteroid isomerase-like protein
MKQLIVLLAVSVSLFACTSATDKKEKESLAVAKRYMQAVESNNVAAMDSILADNYMGYGPSVGDSTNKTDALASWKYNAEQLYESVTYTRHQSLAVTVKDNEEVEAGNWVSNWAYLTIKFRDGRGTANLWVNAAYRIENGKIVRSRTFYNESDVLRQLGYNWVAGRGKSD